MSTTNERTGKNAPIGVAAELDWSRTGYTEEDGKRRTTWDAPSGNHEGYHVQQDDSRRWSATLSDDFANSETIGDWQGFATAAEAKAACQRHYNDHVWRLLSPRTRKMLGDTL